MSERTRSGQGSRAEAAVLWISNRAGVTLSELESFVRDAREDIIGNPVVNVDLDRATGELAFKVKGLSRNG